MARQNGWFVVFYSYQFNGKSFSGESRRWLLFSFSSVESQTGKITTQLPRGTALVVRVNPNDPSRSVAEL
jgi:hypothetical protein